MALSFSQGKCVREKFRCGVELEVNRGSAHIAESRAVREKTALSSLTHWRIWSFNY